tara:strand:- start:19591 stop:19935 length:345 start_codon:yes stop_codon:yes gene_type:complete
MPTLVRLMKKILRRASVRYPHISFAIIAIVLSSSLFADDYEKAKELVDAGKILPLERILEELNKRSTGRVIEVELELKKGRLIYEIEQIDAHGLVREYIFDAADGHLLMEKVED